MVNSLCSDEFVAAPAQKIDSTEIGKVPKSRWGRRPLEATLPKTHGISER